MTQRLLTLTLLSALTLAFTACGGGGSGSDATDTSSNTNTTTTTSDSNGSTATGNTSGGSTGNTGGGGNTLDTLLGCIDVNNDKGFASATDVTTKTLHKLTADTKVNVWDLNNGTKKACTVSGSVELL